ncbi:hypothetical protein Ahy_B04g071373 [Arachis hypogaea]|uniref:DUF223 domain-containing protein n=1 Tax=Arachis hypogaea TaxID=3818 RepID=A0A444ZKK0_ARAHY|nr:hypothetical protein Ahy_B04g071373 [Arachis hypogaea]
MATSYDSINNITYGRLCNEKVWKIKTRVIRLWKVPSKFDKNKTAFIEIVLMDDKMFENDLIEGKVYVFSNFLIEELSRIYLPTTHVCRITFKKELRVANTVNDDVIGLLTKKEKLISWSKVGKSGYYIVVDLHD